MTLDDLKKQLDSTEAEFEAAKAHVHRCDGAIQVLNHFIADEEAKIAAEPPVIDAEIVPGA